MTSLRLPQFGRAFTAARDRYPPGVLGPSPVLRLRVIRAAVADCCIELSKGLVW